MFYIKQPNTKVLKLCMIKCYKKMLSSNLINNTGLKLTLITPAFTVQSCLVSKEIDKCQT